MLQRFPHGVAVDIVHGLGAQEGAVEVGQDAIVKSDVGLLGIEQDPVAIEGYQFDQVVVPMRGGVAVFPAGLMPGAAAQFLKYYIIRFLSIINAPRKRREVPGKAVGNPGAGSG